MSSGRKQTKLNLTGETKEHRDWIHKRRQDNKAQVKTNQGQVKAIRVEQVIKTGATKADVTTDSTR